MSSLSEYQIRQEICDIGRRIYQRGFAAGNDGNISHRLGPARFLCTPTMICKGFMKPHDLCLVDLDGNQVAGRKKRTSEIMLHLAIYRARPDMRSVVHCHPPHATAFAVAREPIPQCVLPEVEMFLGEVPIARYATPGSQKFAETVLPMVHKTNVILLANHGTVSFGETVERAFWWTEILDAYCRILMLARDLGGVPRLDARQARELLQLKGKWGFGDPRLDAGLDDCEICNNAIFRDTWAENGIAPRAFPPADLPELPPQAVVPHEPSSGARLPQHLGLVEAVADRVSALMNSN